MVTPGSSVGALEVPLRYDRNDYLYSHTRDGIGCRTGKSATFRLHVL